MYIANIINNRVIGIVVGDSVEYISSLPLLQGTFELYDESIHPWGPNGPCDIEIGPNWKDRLKEKIGYCMFCGDGITEPDHSGSL